MKKNEIHARLPPHLMESLKSICDERKCNLSDITRAALTLYVDAYNSHFLYRKYCLVKNENTLSIQLIEECFLEIEPSTPEDLEVKEKSTTLPPINLVENFEPETFIDW